PECGDTALRSRSRLARARRDEGRRRGAPPLRPVRADDARGTRSADVGLRLLREPPDDRAATRDGAGVRELALALLGRLRQVLDALDGRVLRPAVVERVEQLLRELLRYVDARDDDPGDLALLDRVGDAGEGQRELVVGEADVGEVGVRAGEMLAVDLK